MVSPLATSGVRPHGAGVGNLILATLSATRSSSSAAIIRSARRNMFCAATALVALAPILAAWVRSADGLLLGVGALAAAALLVGGAGVEVLLPAHVVDVDLAAHGVEEPHPVDDLGEQLDVVADDHQPAGVCPQEVAQPADRVGVEVVGRLVEQQRGRRTWRRCRSEAANRIRASSTRRR